MRFFLLLIVFLIPASADLLVLKNGQVVVTVGPYQIKDGMVFFSGEDGEEYALPTDAVDFSASKAKTTEPVPQAKVKKPGPPPPKDERPCLADAVRPRSSTSSSASGGIVLDQDCLNAYVKENPRADNDALKPSSHSSSGGSSATNAAVRQAVNTEAHRRANATAKGAEFILLARKQQILSRLNSGILEESEIRSLENELQDIEFALQQVEAEKQRIKESARRSGAKNVDASPRLTQREKAQVREIEQAIDEAIDEEEQRQRRERKGYE